MDQYDEPSDTEQSLVTNDHRTSSKWSRFKHGFLNFFNAERRHNLQMYALAAIDNRATLREVVAILNGLRRDFKDQYEGRIVELHVPGNDACLEGTQGFFGRVDTGSLGYSFVKQHVLEAINGRYIPLENLSHAQQERCRKIRSFNGTPLDILGIANILLYPKE